MLFVQDMRVKGHKKKIVSFYGGKSGITLVTVSNDKVYVGRRQLIPLRNLIDEQIVNNNGGTRPSKSQDIGTLINPLDK